MDFPQMKEDIRRDSMRNKKEEFPPGDEMSHPPDRRPRANNSCEMIKLYFNKKRGKKV